MYHYTSTSHDPNLAHALLLCITMQECLRDIEHAIHHGYVVSSPEDKLLKRKEKCRTQQRKAQQLQTSNGTEDPSDLKPLSAFESEHVAVRSHHTCGRYIEVFTIVYIPACSRMVF